MNPYEETGLSESGSSQEFFYGQSRIEMLTAISRTWGRTDRVTSHAFTRTR